MTEEQIREEAQTGLSQVYRQMLAHHNARATAEGYRGDWVATWTAVDDPVDGTMLGVVLTIAKPGATAEQQQPKETA